MRVSDIIGLTSYVLLLSGCASTSRSTVWFDQLQPAAVSMPQSIDTLYLVDAVGVADLSDSTIKMSELVQRLELEAQEKTLPRKLVDAVELAIRNSHYVPPRTPKVGKQSPATLRQCVDSLLRRHPGSGVLTLECLRGNSWFEFPPYRGEGDQCVDIVCRTLSQFRLTTRTTEFALPPRSDTLVFRGCGATNADIARHLPSLPDKYASVCRDVCDRTLPMFIPQWQRIRRDLIVGTDYASQSAAELAGADKWPEAQSAWEGIYSGVGSAADRARAAINVAICHERADEAYDASVWASMALDLIEAADDKTQKLLAAEKRQAEGIFAAALHRIDQLPTLNRQMGAE